MCSPPILIRSTLTLACLAALCSSPEPIHSQFWYSKPTEFTAKTGRNDVFDHTPAAGASGGVAHHHRRLARGWAALGGGVGARGAELRLDPEAGDLQLQPQHPRRVPQAGEAPRPAHQGPDHRYDAPLMEYSRLVCSMVYFCDFFYAWDAASCRCFFLFILFLILFSSLVN